MSQLILQSDLIEIRLLFLLDHLITLQIVMLSSQHRTLDADAFGNRMLLPQLFFCVTRIDSAIAIFHSEASNSKSGTYASN